MVQVEFLCLTKKQKFTVDDPKAVQLTNGRWAYRERCPWDGKNGKELYAFKFCSQADWLRSSQEVAEKFQETSDEQQGERSVQIAGTEE